MATEVASLTALLSLDDSGFTRGMRNAEQKISGIGGTFQNMGASLKNLGGNLQSMGMQASMATAPIAAMGAVGIKAYGDFESVINEISARTGIVGDELQAISDYALEMGAATVFSGQQASEAFLDLLTSGQSAEEAFSTLPHVMSLAAAGGIELGQSADTLTDIMSMFGLAASDTIGNLTAAEYVANSLTQASQVSSASVSMLGQAFVNVGGIASGFGLDVDTTNAALAVLAEGGLKGAEAGTNLKSMLLGMSSTTNSTQEAWVRLGTTMYDSEGNMKNLNSLLGEIRYGLQDLPVEEQNEIIMGLAGSYGQLSLRTLLFGNDLAETQGKMEEAAAASVVAEQMMASWNNQVNSLMGSMESLAISVLGPFVESTLKPIVAQAIEVVNSIKAWADANPELAQTIVKIAAAAVLLGPVLIGIGTAVSVLGVALSGLGVVLGFVLSPIGLLIGAVAALSVAFIKDFGGIRTWFNRNILPWLVGLADAFTIGGWENAWTYIKGVFIEPFIEGLQSFLSGGEVFQKAKTFGTELLNAMKIKVSRINKWLNVNLIKPLVSKIHEMVAGAGGARKIFTTLQGFGFKLLENGFNIGKGILKFVWEKLFKPLGDAIGKYVNSGDLQKDLQKLGTMLMDAIGKGIELLRPGLAWINEKLFKPLGDAIGKYVNSGNLQKDLERLGAMLMDAIGKGIGLLGKGLSWVNDNLIKPLGDAIGKYVNSGQLQSILERLGAGFMDAIGKGIRLLGKGIKWVNENLIKPLGNAIGKYVNSGDLQKHLEKLGAGFMTAISAGLNLLGQGLTWVYENLIRPLGDAIVTYVTSGKLVEDLQSLGAMFMDAIGKGLNLLGQGVTWVYENLIRPLGDAIFNFIDSGQLADILITLGIGFLDLIGTGITFVKSIPAWIYDTLIKPLFTSIGDESGSGGGLWESLMGFGQSILEGIGAGLNMLGGFATWIWEKVIDPFITAMAEHIGIGEIWEQLKSFGGSILEGIGAGLTYIQNVGAWLYNTLIAPLVGGLTVEGGTTGDLWQSLLSLGQIFLDAVGAGLQLIVSIGTWIRDTFIGPIIDAIGNFIGVGDLYDKLIEFGNGILTAVANGLGDVAMWVYENLIKPFEDAVNAILETLGLVGEVDNSFRIMKATGGNLPKNYEMRANGGPVMAGNPYIVGEVGPELFVPSSSGTIIPNDALGGRIEIGTININATGDVDGAQLARSFELELAEIMRSRG
jgi:TP901 family phage tail tape measure protein